MIKSLTAFARQEADMASGAMTCELRSVNHRYLEVSVRLPEELRSIETSLRDKAKQHLGRGKVEGQFRYAAAPGAASTIAINTELADSVIAAAQNIEARMTNPAPLSARDILAWPGVTIEPPRDVDALKSGALELFDKTLRELVEMREREGERLQTMISERGGAIRKLVAQVRERRPAVVQTLRDKLLSRLQDLEAQFDNNRLEQELAYMAQKMDVDEELDRLDSHLTELDDSLGKKEPVGRRLDFLMQEFNREANTLGSKSTDIETTQLVVEIKVLIEQIREQVQNVE